MTNMGNGRILGLDYGSVRLGVAISDLSQCIAYPLPSMRMREFDSNFQCLKHLCQEKQVKYIVLGLPKQLNGKEGQSAEKARQFGKQLSHQLQQPVIFFDERLSTRLAERLLIDAGLSRKKRRGKIDSVSAAVILQNYLECQDYHNGIA